MMKNLYPHQPGAALKPGAFLTTHVLHLQRIGGGGAETLVECRSRAISNVYFSVIKLAFCRFLLDDVITAAASLLYWQEET